KAMAYFMKSTSHELTFFGNRINLTYGSRHFRSIIDKQHYFNQAYKYFYRNPVVAGACDNVEDYKYSTLHALLGRSKLLVPVESDDLLFNDVEKTLNWLNTPTNEEDWRAVGNALRKQ